jgi:hypothetical protein
VFVIVRNVIWHNIWFLVWFAWQVASHLSLLIRLDFIPEIFRIRASGGTFPQFLLCVYCFSTLVFAKKRRAQASAQSAAFETGELRSITDLSLGRICSTRQRIN